MHAHSLTHTISQRDYVLGSPVGRPCGTGSWLHIPEQQFNSLTLDPSPLPPSPALTVQPHHTPRKVPLHLTCPSQLSIIDEWVALRGQTGRQEEGGGAGSGGVEGREREGDRKEEASLRVSGRG